jgi:hypothetical protein
MFIGLNYINNLNGFVGIVVVDSHGKIGRMKHSHPTLDPLLENLRDMAARYRAWAAERSNDRAVEYARLALDCDRTIAELERLAQRKGD